MNKKTINAILLKKMKEFWNSIEDEDLRKQVEKETIVTGGCIVSMLLKEKVVDYDIYFQSHDTVLRLVQYYVNKFKTQHNNETLPIDIYDNGERIKIVVQSAGIVSEAGTDLSYQYFENRPPEEAQTYVHEIINNPEDIENVYEETQEKALEQKGDYHPVFLSTNAITLSNKIQIIIRFYGTPEQIHENYDYVHCTNYWTKKDGVVLNQEALECILNKELLYVGSKYPLCSIIRSRKFIKRGWHINAGQFVKMCFQISLLDFNNVEVLEDQLTGVDVAYFSQVIDILKEKNKKDGSDKIESAYLIEILNRMF